MARRNRPRRGVLLLVILSILVLFLLIGMTFVLVAGQYRQGAAAAANKDLTGVDPAKQLDGAMHQLLRGPDPASRSSLLGHSLLEDMYGGDSVSGVVGSASYTAGGQLISIGFSAGNLRSDDDYYNGRVFTILDGPAKGYSTRVAAYSAGKIVVEAFDSDLPGGVAPGKLSGARFLINGAAFNGTGAGYPQAGTMGGPGTAKLTASFGGGPVALQPNFAAYATNLTASPNLGGADESYDAVDFQNMFMAMVPPNATGSSDIIPSFHRPALVSYWQTQGAGPDVLKRVMLRPMPWDHPNFTGSNPFFKPVTGPWDVDNDRDGVPDSIWIDLGYPTQSAPDGRLYRPLFAILCVDQDGKLNLNAHGNLWQIAQYSGGSGGNLYTMPVPGPYADASGSPVDLPRGSGYGPAEVYLGAVLDNTEQENVFLARYGIDQRDRRPGAKNTDDPPVPNPNRFKTAGLPPSVNDPNNFVGANRPSRYGSPPDVWGRGVLGLDIAGEPLPQFMGAAWSQASVPGQGQMLFTETLDDPYELNLVRPAAGYGGRPIDTPFTPAELERMLRWNDFDATALPDRLMRMAPTALGDPQIRRMVTTRSFDVPALNFQPPPGLRSGLQEQSGVIDLVRLRLQQGGVADVAAQLEKMLPPEILHGGRMNVNSFIDPVRDQNGQILANIPTLQARQLYARHLFCLMMLLTDRNYLHPTSGVETLDEASRRELTVRRIAQWAINCVDFRDPDSIMTPFEYDVNPFDGWDVDDDYRTEGEKDRRLVWGSEYPDLILTETLAFHDRRVKDTKLDASGKKRFEKKGGGGDGDGDGDGGAETDPKKVDDDLDQYRIPQGSLFIELYCTRGRPTNNPVYPLDLCTQEGYLDLGRVAPPSADGTSRPVWRIAISGRPRNPQDSAAGRRLNKPDSTSFDPQNMSRLPGVIDPISTPLPVERIIWFSTNSPGDEDPEAGRVYYNRTGPVALPPGGYLTVGPRKVTYVGSRKDGNPPDQKIALAGGYFTYEGTAAPLPSVGSEIQPPVGIVAGANLPADWGGGPSDGAAAPDGIGISVSEPLPQSGFYYPKPEVKLSTGEWPLVDAYGDVASPDGTSQPPDKPFDEDKNRPLGKDDSVRATGTTLDYETAFLQRLANPLQPWDPRVNPYITIDWMPIDLTVFNGEDDDNEDEVAEGFPEALGPFDPDNLNDDNVRFSSRQRGCPRSGGGNGGAPDANVWAQTSEDPRDTNPSATEVYFRHRLDSSLGYLNPTLSPLYQSPPSAEYVGAPQRPFPWLTWNNRPFFTPLEMMLVPSSSPSRLLHEFTLEVQGADPYRSGGQPEDFFAPYGHLLNFFQTSNEDVPAAHFYRIFDYLEVPSPYEGTEKWYDRSQFPATNGPAGFGTPFNHLSRFRNPGLVNINTIFDLRVWQGVTAGFPQMSWDRLFRSRRGYDAGGAGQYPTQFANPFRSAGSADLVPPLATGTMVRKGVEVTLLRPESADSNEPLFGYESRNAYEDTRRNAYFRYHGLSRLGNLVTTHSNVYAVWITVGYFQVDPITGQLGQELGSETGEVQRHRAFYLIDRSIPVGFEPGRNHNVDRAVVLRRFIE